MQKYLFLPHYIVSIFLACFFGIFSVQGKIEEPNYQFTLDKLKPFYPGNDLKNIQSQFKKGQVMNKEGTLYRFEIIHQRYRFAVFVEMQGNKSVGFFTRLPQYFLHDVFHQSLINRMGKQDLYKKKENAAIYVWKNVKGNEIEYSGTCTITCFPTYLSVRSLKSSKENSLLGKLNISQFKTKPQKKD